MFHYCRFKLYFYICLLLAAHHSLYFFRYRSRYARTVHLYTTLLFYVNDYILFLCILHKNNNNNNTKCIFACRRDVTDPGGDRRRVRHRHLPRDHRQHLRRLRLGSHPEQLSGGDHGDGGLHQLLRHHAAERGECLPPIGDSGAEMRRCMKSDHQIFKGYNKDLQSI